MKVDRLTDGELQDVSARVLEGKCYRCAGTGNEQPWRMCSACDGTGVFALSTETMLGVLAELRERRAADLTAAELDALTEVNIDLDLDATPWERCALVVSAFEKIFKAAGREPPTVLVDKNAMPGAKS